MSLSLGRICRAMGMRTPTPFKERTHERNSRYMNHEVRVHGAFREHQKAVNTAWSDYHTAVHEFGVDSGEAMAAELHLRNTRTRLRQFMARPRVEP